MRLSISKPFACLSASEQAAFRPLAEALRAKGIEPVLAIMQVTAGAARRRRQEKAKTRKKAEAQTRRAARK